MRSGNGLGWACNVALERGPRVCCRRGCELESHLKPASLVGSVGIGFVSGTKNQGNRKVTDSRYSGSLGCSGEGNHKGCSYEKPVLVATVSVVNQGTVHNSFSRSYAQEFEHAEPLMPQLEFQTTPSEGLSNELAVRHF